MRISDELEFKIKVLGDAAGAGTVGSDLSTLIAKFRAYYDLDTCDFGALSKVLYDPASNSVHGQVLAAVALVDEVRAIVDVSDLDRRAAVQAGWCRDLSAAALAYQVAVDTTKARLNYALDWAIADVTYDEGLVAVYNWLTNALDVKVAEFDEGLDRDLRSVEAGPFVPADLDEPAGVTAMLALYRAGGRTFPLAASRYEAAGAVVARLGVSGPEKHFPRSVARYNELLAELLTSLKDTEDEIHRRGPALTATARAMRVSMRRNRRKS